MRPPARELPVYAAPLVAFLLVAASFVAQGHIGLNLADEGFLWHGAMRTLAGDVPIRDFQSYDPARYYWSALWMKLAGSNGIIALRLSVALFQACAFTVGLLLVRHVTVRPLPFLVVAVVFLLWFIPRHKLFDVSLSIWAVYVGTILIEQPSVKRHFLAGLYVGIAAVFGRNHGVYALIATFALGMFAWARLDRARPIAKLLFFFAGIGIGYVPILWLAGTQPGFLSALADSVLVIIRSGTTNLPVPVPWPWVVDYQLPWQWAVHRLFVGMTFVAMPALYTVGAIVALRERQPEVIQRNSVFVASIAVGIVYMHYAFARADVGHLAHAIYPFLFALLSFPGLQRRATFAMPLALLVYSIFAAALMSPLYARIADRNYVDIEVRGDKLTVDVPTARAVHAVQLVSQSYMQEGEQIVFAPYWPTMYGVLGRRAPVWESYAISASIQRQQRFTMELERGHVEWAVIGNALLDGRDDRRFSNTHPLVWRYLVEHYDPVQIQGLPADYRLLRRRMSNAAQLWRLSIRDVSSHARYLIGIPYTCTGAL